MPVYDHECQSCEARFEVFASMEERDTPAVCPVCTGASRHIITATAGVKMGWPWDRPLYQSGLADYPDDPNAYCSTRNEAHEKAKRKGLAIIHEER